MKRPDAWLIAAVALLLLAAWLYWRTPLAVPPGLEMDELIEAQIAEKVLDGDWRPFYPAGQGREALYHYWLAGWLALLGRNVFTLRFASTSLTLLGLAAGYALLRRLFSPPVALISLAGGATSFWVLFAARSGLRSTSLPLLAALAAYFFWRALSFPRENAPKKSKGRRRVMLFFILSGFCLGLTFYAYTAARVLPVIFGLFTFYLLLFHRSRLSGRWRGLFLGWLVAFLVVAPLLYYLRTHPEADQFDFLDFDRPLAALERGDPKPAFQTTLATLGGFFFKGDPLIFNNVPGRPIFGPLSGLLFLAGAGVTLARARRPPYAFVLLWLLVSLVPGMLSQPAPNFYRTVAAQVITFVFPGLAIVEGWRYLRQRWTGRRSAIILFGVGALLLAVHGLSSARAYFHTWPTVEGVRFFWQSGLAQAAHYLDSTPDDSPVALCTVLTYEHDPWWRPAWQSMPYLLRRTDLDVRYYDCRTTLVLPAGERVRYLFPDTADPAALIPGEFRGEGLAEATPLPGTLSSGQGLLLELETAPQVAFPTSGAAWWAPEAGGEFAPLPVCFGSSLALLGYLRTPAQPRPGVPLRLIAAWQVLDTPPPRLTLFTHLLSDPQTLVAQQDGLALTAHSLRAGDRFLVLHDQVWVPAEPAVERYLLSIGLYDSDTLLRLPLYERDQACDEPSRVGRGDRLFLETVDLEGP
jgi:hypothetical protein